MDKICRICLRVSDSEVFFVSIFQNFQTDLLQRKQFATAEALQIICGITVSKNDGYPDAICSKCHEQLKEAIQLRQLAQNSQQTMHGKLASTVDDELVISKAHCSDDDKSDFDIPQQEDLHQVCSDDDEDVDWKANGSADEDGSLTSLEFDDQPSVPKNRKNCTTEAAETLMYCCGCNKSFNREFTLRKHSFNHLRAKGSDSLTKVECHVCYDQFEDQAALAAHRAGKNELKSLRCEFCLRRFLSLEKFDAHQVAYHADRKFKCCGCKFNTLKRIQLAKHSLVHNGPGNEEESSSAVKAHQCPVCYVRFETLHQKELHQWTPYRLNQINRKTDRTKQKPKTTPRSAAVLDAKEHNPHRTVPVCCGCRCMFSSLQVLRNHQEQSHKPPDQKAAYECSDCHKQFKLKREFHEHFQRKKFKCSKCNIIRSDQQAIERHLAVHDSELGAFLCCGCKERAESLDALKKHGLEEHFEKEQRRMQSAEERPFQCEICYRRYETARMLHGHQHDAYRERNFICELCGQGYFTQGKLDIHKALVHQNEANYPCGTCGKLHKHVRLARACESIHRNRKDHPCTVCGAVFKSKYLLVSHRLIHTDVRKHKCDICAKTFRRNQQLQKHITIDHRNERNFACPFCPKRFGVAASLSKHKLTHTGFPYRCELCNKRLKTRQNYIQHYETHRTDADKVFQCERCDQRYSQGHFLANQLRFVLKADNYTRPIQI
ncbi:zinc finger protein 99-like [Ochlerotatus camptorhynchus]|uniref:zinc finger protein 99-like n=1 Tax=Ochlerotatus camptorhynchus TaxID=644619 RepID=UPI0031D09E38